MSVVSVVWSEKYSVGCQTIDEDHQYIFSLLNKATIAVERYDANDCISEVLNQLLDYTQTHFMDEEALMKRALYPGYMRHHQQHNTLLHQVEDLLDECRSGSGLISRSVLIFLNKWIAHHILEDDMQFSLWLKQPLELV